MVEIARPQDSNIDAWGFTHPGKVRPEKQDHFFLGLWPHAYLLQLGDSRAYICQDGALTQISRDPTWA
jgi:serine/threonine protein phosphatase PrpC